MRLKADKFTAIFSPMLNEWDVTTDDFNFKIKNLSTHHYEGTFKCDYQKIYGAKVELDLIENWCFIERWETINKEKLCDWCNPDMPKGLAKTVTVK